MKALTGFKMHSSIFLFDYSPELGLQLILPGVIVQISGLWPRTEEMRLLINTEWKPERYNSWGIC